MNTEPDDQAAELDRRAGLARHQPAPHPTHPHDPQTIELGRRKIAEIRAQLAERKANR